MTEWMGRSRLSCSGETTVESNKTATDGKEKEKEKPKKVAPTISPSGCAEQSPDKNGVGSQTRQSHCTSRNLPGNPASEHCGPENGTKQIGEASEVATLPFEVLPNEKCGQVVEDDEGKTSASGPAAFGDGPFLHQRLGRCFFLFFCFYFFFGHWLVLSCCSQISSTPPCASRRPPLEGGGKESSAVSALSA